MKEVAVVLTYFNPDSTLLRALDSICTQSYKPKQLIIVDDGSNNGFLLPTRTAKTLSKNFEFFHLKNTQNIGLTKSLIKAIKHVNCDYIARLDADDFWLPDHIFSCVQAINKLDLDLIGGSCFIYNDNFKKNFNSKSDAYILKRFHIFNKLVHSSVVFSFSFYRKIGGYDQSFRYAQDFELWLRFQKNDARIGFLNQRTMVRELSNSNISEKYRIEQQNYCLDAIKKNSNSILYVIFFVTLRKIFHALANLKRKYNKWC